MLSSFVAGIAGGLVVLIFIGLLIVSCEIEDWWDDRKRREEQNDE